MEQLFQKWEMGVAQGFNIMQQMSTSPNLLYPV
jgi:hypothetical protein